ncbi:MAG: DUF1571 domain-containing protein [Planctomycetaceae bacterium]|nr:DUF1571 domain-containing protein [Planctomycetaceae bacterium]
MFGEVRLLLLPSRFPTLLFAAGSVSPNARWMNTMMNKREFLKVIGGSGLAFSVFPLLVAQQQPASEHPLVPAIRYARMCLEKVEALPGYEATFYKQEVVDNATVKHRMKIKVRHNPFSVYLYFENPYEGREVIFVEGQNNGKLLAHEGGLLSVVGTMELAPSDPTAMTENRYPITRAGIAKLVQGVIDQWESEIRYDESEVKYYKDAKLGSTTCRVIECTHPVPRKQFNFHRTRLWINDADGLPIRVQQFGFPPNAGAPAPIVEDYTFTDIKTDVRLTDADFDRNNSRYNF